jgi:cell division septation protein DedD
MTSSADTEITLGTGKLLGLFFFLVAVCAVFFALGYTLGRKSDVTLAAASMGAPQTSASTAKPAAQASTQPMTFYKSVEQKEANPQLTPATGDAASGAAQPPAAQTLTAAGAAPAASSPASGTADPMAAPATTGYFVQVAAVSKQDDAEALVDALKKKQYPAFVANNSSVDKLLRVQVGPFGDVRDAESMRARLINDGYSPILKK